MNLSIILFLMFFNSGVFMHSIFLGQELEKSVREKGRQEDLAKA